MLEHVIDATTRCGNRARLTLELFESNFSLLEQRVNVLLLILHRRLIDNVPEKQIVVMVVQGGGIWMEIVPTLLYVVQYRCSEPESLTMTGE